MGIRRYTFDSSEAGRATWRWREGARCEVEDGLGDRRMVVPVFKARGTGYRAWRRRAAVAGVQAKRAMHHGHGRALPAAARRICWRTGSICGCRTRFGGGADRAITRRTALAPGQRVRKRWHPGANQRNAQRQPHRPGAESLRGAYAVLKHCSKGGRNIQTSLTSCGRHDHLCGHRQAVFAKPAP